MSVIHTQNLKSSSFATALPSSADPVSINIQIQNLDQPTFTTVLSTITSVKVEYYTFTTNAINFVLNVDLYGWNYSTSRYDGISHGARPIWVMASDQDDDYTKRKNIDIWSGAPVLVDEYNFITQPPYSNMYFGTNTYLEYNKRDTGSIIWKQPIKGSSEIENKKWCEILIDTSAVSNLSAVLYNNINDLVVSATDIVSDITFSIIQNSPLLINYYARSAFTWVQSISNSSLGLPPTGGVWIPIEQSTLVVPDVPYAHLTNRHYPTYASVPSVGELYSTKDKGGYVIPKRLGSSTAVSKNRINSLATDKLINDPAARGMTAIYRDLSTYNTDRGLSERDQIEPVVVDSIDTRWMKASVVQGQKSGIIVQAREHQEFMPYQTKYETIGSNDNGLYRQGNDAYDPWFKDLDTTWENSEDWPPNWRKQYDIEGWYKQQDKGNQQIYQWKTDIFGNQYAVLKAGFQYASIYDKKHTIPGSLWTRNARNMILQGATSLEQVFAAAPDLSGIDIRSLSNTTSGILDIDVWFDTLMIYTSSALFFFQLNFDYSNGIISSTSDQTNYVITQNSKFGGTWFLEDDRKVTVCTLLSCGDQIRPILRTLDLETNELSFTYNQESTYTNTSAFGYTSFDHPVFTYDGNTKTYNISYIAYNGTKTGMYVNSINIKNYGEYFDISNSKTIVPEA